jgi:hypothetical protein
MTDEDAIANFVIKDKSCVTTSQVGRGALHIRATRISLADQTRIAAVLERLGWMRPREWKGNRHWVGPQNWRSRKDEQTVTVVPCMCEAKTDCP